MTQQIKLRQDRIRGRRERRKLARQARFRRQVVRYLVLIVLLVVGIYGLRYVPWCIADADRDIVVEGNQVASVDQVRGALLNCVGKPLYGLDPALLERQVRSLEAVRNAFVRRYLFPRPHLLVQVQEEFPWATFASNPEKPPEAVIAESGRIIPLSEFPAVVRPAFRIFGTRELKLSSSQVSQWASWVACIAAQTGQPVDSVDLREPQIIKVQTGDLHLRLGSADSTLTRRIGRLASVMPALGPLRERLEYIDLGLDNNVPMKLTRAIDKPGRPLAQALQASWPVGDTERQREPATPALADHM